MRYQAHVNTNYCNKSNSVKYLFKYVNKGSDRATMKITDKENESTEMRIVDEIKKDIMIVNIYLHVKQFGEFMALISIIDGLLLNV